MALCKCGCGGEARNKNRYVLGHSSRVVKYMKVAAPCACGCGAMAKKGNKFLHGHNRQGFFHDEDTKKRIRETNLETYSNPEVIQKFMGENNPSFGTKHPDRIRAIMQAKAQERCSDPEFIRKITVTTKAALSDPAKREKISANSIAMWKNAVSRKILMKERRERWHDPEFVEKYRKGRDAKPNRKEILLFSILQGMFPGEWKYTGDYRFWIDGKNPDFVNCNGQKKIIELFGDYWHRGKCPGERALAFSPFGYTTLVVWEAELKDQAQLEKRLQSFNEVTHEAE